MKYHFLVKVQVDIHVVESPLDDDLLSGALGLDMPGGLVAEHVVQEPPDEDVIYHPGGI